MKLHLGCGTKKLKGYVNCDISPEVKPDVVVDIMELSKKFRPNSVDEIITEHTIEHVEDFTRAMREIHKVLKKGGKAKIVVPYATIPNAFHPHHRWYFTKESFAPFEMGHGLSYYYNFHFSKVKTKLIFNWFNKWIAPLANSKPWIYENTGLAWLFPASELHIEMVK